MNIEVLVSTMNQKDFSLIEKMRITTDAVVVNQCGRDETIVFQKNGKTIKWINSSTSGLSISRNICLKNATGDICLLADDDLEYVDGYEMIVSNAFLDHAAADIIRFKVEGIEKEFKSYPDKPKKIGLLYSLKSSSVELAFRKSCLSGIWFDELIGSGTKYCMGEENALLVHCLRNNARMMFVPETISHLHLGASSWQNLTTEQYLISRGAAFEAMDTPLIHALILQFAVRKRYLYRNSFSITEAVRLMYQGRHSYQSDRTNNQNIISAASFNTSKALTIKDLIKEQVKLFYACPNYKNVIKGLRNANPKIILFGTPVHGNLGDHAIAISELDFLNRIAGSRSVIEILMPLYKTHRKLIKKLVRNEDVIIISGGGWMGNLWIKDEITIRGIVSDYPDNRVIIFPQTLYYTDDDEGTRTAEVTKAVLEQHEKLFLTVRDMASFEYAEKNLGFKRHVNLFFCPDMALYGTLAMDIAYQPDSRTALVCFRNDVEKKLDANSVIDLLHETSYFVKETTTISHTLVPVKKRKQYVEKKIREFQEASIVVTDRLHAMIFSLLAGTPCIAFDNATGKVFGVGEYLSGNGSPLYLLNDQHLPDITEVNTEKVQYVLPAELKEHFHVLESLVIKKEPDEK